MGSAVQEDVLTGRCQCGATRYEVTGAPLGVYVCHCLECRRQSASAFGISVMVRRADLLLVAGSPRRWSRRADSGRTVDCFFCDTCGARLWHGYGEHEAIVSIKGGSLDHPVDLGPAIHIWTARKLPGVIIPDAARQYRGEPD